MVRTIYAFLVVVRYLSCTNVLLCFSLFSEKIVFFFSVTIVSEFMKLCNIVGCLLFNLSSNFLIIGDVGSTHQGHLYLICLFLYVHSNFLQLFSIKYILMLFSPCDEEILRDVWFFPILKCHGPVHISLLFSAVCL